MPVITRFQLKNSNAMRDRRARIRAIRRDNIVETRPICTLEISQYSESSDDETDSVCSCESSEFDFEFESDSEYVPSSDEEETDTETLEETIALLKNDIAEIEKRIEIENTPKNGRSWCGFALSNLVLTTMFIMYCAYIVDKAHYNVA